MLTLGSCLQRTNVLNQAAARSPRQHHISYRYFQQFVWVCVRICSAAIFLFSPVPSSVDFILLLILVPAHAYALHTSFRTIECVVNLLASIWSLALCCPFSAWFRKIHKHANWALLHSVWWCPIVCGRTSDTHTHTHLCKLFNAHDRIVTFKRKLSEISTHWRRQSMGKCLGARCPVPGLRMYNIMCSQKRAINTLDM